MRCSLLRSLCLALLIFPFSALASDQKIFAAVTPHEEATSRALFQKVFTEWTNAFNHQNTESACRLFAPELVATYKNFPVRNYHAVCEDFKKIFAYPNRRYQYQFKLGPIYRSADLAAVRITWFLTLYNAHGKKLFQTRDEGLDILRKQPTGEWKIVHYLAYAV